MSIPANRAEGFKRKNRPDTARHRNVAQASLEERRYCFIPTKDCGYGGTLQPMSQREEVGKLLESCAASMLAPGS